MRSTEKATIIIPTGGRSEAIARTLASIKQFAPKTEVIVIGDRDDEPTRRLLRESFSWITYMEIDERSAVVKRNLGITCATNDILIFVDDDVIVETDWLNNLLRHFLDDSVGGVGGRVKVPGIGVGPASLATGTIRNGFVIGNWNPPIKTTVEVQHLIGCNMSFRKGLVMKLGGFDNFFRSCNFREDTDLCLRIGRVGYRIFFDPGATLTHEALGRKRQGSRWVYYYVRNTFYLYLKYQVGRSSSLGSFFRGLFFPPKEYASISGVRVWITLVTPIVTVGGIVAGFLGYLGHR